jgi:hypothetical protein
MSETAEARTYRFAPRDRAGWLLGLAGVQCLLVAAGLVASGTLLSAGAPGVLVPVPVVLGLVGAFVGWDRQPLHELLPVAMAWVLRSDERRFHATLAPVLSGRVAQPSLPAWFGPLRLVDLDGGSWAPGGLGVVLDTRARTYTGVLSVSGREFALLDRVEQERLLATWGDAFCAERGPVARVVATEWSAPAGLEEHLSYLGERQAGADDEPAVAAYRELLDRAGPLATRHQVLLSVTVAAQRLRSSHRGGDLDSVAAEVLVEQLRLLAARLEAAGLAAEAPLTAGQIAHALRLRCDPGVQPVLARRARTLSDAVGGLSAHNAGPLAAEATWRHVKVDCAFHASYWVAEWPRLEVGPNWLEPMLLHAGGTRSFALVVEPVAPSASQRQIDRDATRLASDEEQRSRGGWRVGARHHRAQAAVAEREAELVAGYPEVGFTGLLTVTAADPEALERSCAEYEQVAAQAGLELRRLDGRHHLALAATLPLGRPVANPRLG